jgi:hypothetical protein
VVAGYNAWRYARRLWNDQPGLVGLADGSTNPIVCSVGGALARVGLDRRDPDAGVDQEELERVRT